MNKADFAALCREKIVILDGATGTEMVKRGLPPGMAPELFALDRPEALCSIHNAYFASESNIVYTPTFGSNRCKLAEFGAAERVREVNLKLARISRKNAGTRLVFGDIGPTGEFLKPLGNLDFEELVDIFKEQVSALAEGGVDGFAIETQIDLQQARAALIACKESAAELPVIVTMTVDAGGHTLSGNPAEACLVALQSLGADAFGMNCSVGPSEMLGVLARLKPYAKIPLAAKPNAGLPHLVNGRTVFDLDPESFAERMLALAAAGANIVGGCCGSTPEHIEHTAAALREVKPVPVKCEHPAVIASATEYAELSLGRKTGIVGERINPTGKKALQAELRAGKMDLVRTFAREQTEKNALLLDVNMGLGGVDEKALMLEAVEVIQSVTGLPLAIDSAAPEVMEAALRRYPGRALVNSISGEPERIEKMLPIAAKYGAMIVVLPVDATGVPENLEARKAMTQKVFAAAAEHGYGKSDCLVDILVMTVATGANNAIDSLAMIDFAREFGCGTVAGLSNISFGLPNRAELNAAFFKLAAKRGLTCAIANPNAPWALESPEAEAVLLNQPGAMTAFLARGARVPEPEPAEPGKPLPLEELVLRGDQQNMPGAVRNALDSGEAPDDLMNRLIGAINAVGDRFSAGKLFLPQLLMAADAMRAGIAVLEPLLSRKPDEAAADTVVIATVEGDIHDIGKNIVALMLRNCGFAVVDLGKDVPSSKIVGELKRTGARFCGLSALMTTTMPRMKEVIELARTEGLAGVKFMVGGAAVDRAYADSIGAAYSSDAMGAVNLCKSL
ncbi:MAG: homocysteine S-methyltransferase family protein [Victivallaceae bacterium]|nr:homocysteine S-methyltransferase family protein [Victivallaceae bacterium]